jgi:hypothetical protein
MSNESASAGPLVFDDFSPGIHQSRYESSVGSTRQGPPPRGAASIENTYRCIGHPDGSLGPLPRQVLSTAIQAGFTAPVRGTISNPGNYPVGQNELYTSDAIVDSSIYLDTTEDAQDDAVVFIGTAWHYDNAAGGNYSPYVATTYYRQSDGVVNDIYLGKSAASAYTAGNMPRSYSTVLLTRAQSTHFGASVPYVVDSIQPIIVHGAAFARMASGVQFIRSNAAMAAGDTALRRGTLQSNYLATAIDYNLMHWPQQQVTAQGQFETVNITTAPGAYVTLPGPSSVIGRAIHHLLVHQGSVVAATTTPLYFGSSTRRHGRELIVFNSPYKVADNGGTASSPPQNYIIPGEESSSGYGAVASMNANELVLFRHDGGALVIRGSLDFPQLVSLPMVEGTYGVECVPVTTPLGVVYLSRNGVFAWNGQDTATKLSQQIDGDLTNYSPTIAPYGSRGRLAWWHPFILAPNNWVMDTRTSGWWRLNDTAAFPVYNCYDTDRSNRLYAFRHKTTQTNNVPFDRYDQATLAIDWSWQSAPVIDELAGGKDRFDSFASVEIVTERASGGTPTVVVTVTGLDERGNQTSVGTASFNLATSSTLSPSAMRVNLNKNVKARYIQVRVVAASGDSATAAPLLRSLTLHRRDSARARTDRG